MALVECGVCKRFFINTAEGETTCPECMAKLYELYPVVRNYLRDNEKTIFTIYELSKALNIEVKYIEGLIALGLIEILGSPHSKKNREHEHKKKGVPKRK